MECKPRVLAGSMPLSESYHDKWGVPDLFLEVLSNYIFYKKELAKQRFLLQREKHNQCFDLGGLVFFCLGKV